jgi:excisionase family DNA binding protein
MDEIKLLSPVQAGQILNCDEQTVRNYIHQRRFKAYKIGGKFQIDEKDLLEYIKKQVY